MPVPVSSLSVAVQGIADFLDGQLGEDVVVATDNPLRASERAKSVEKHLLNVFVYRVMPSGFHADAASDEAFFVRIHALLTPFLADLENAALDADLRILGNAIRILHSNPVIPAVFPGSSSDANDFRSKSHLDYRLQSVLLAPTMEELNHIWTTQGGDLAYRLSAAYEFALIPIEPLMHAEPAGPFTTAVIDTQPSVEAKNTEGFISYGDEANAVPVGGIGSDKPPTVWLPLVLAIQDGALKNVVEVPQGTATINVAIAGLPGSRVALEVAWVRADQSEAMQAPQVVTIATPRIDDPAASVALSLSDTAQGDKATVLTRPVDGANQPLPTSPYANTLSITVGGPQ